MQKNFVSLLFILSHEFASLCAKAKHKLASSFEGLSLQSLPGSASAEVEQINRMMEIK